MSVRATFAVSLVSALSWVPVLRSQEPVSFEVASIKQNTGQPGPPLIDGRTFRQNGQVTVTNMSLGAMIDVLYLTGPGMLIEGGPGWLRYDRFDIVAKGDPGSDASVPPGQRLPRMNAMLRALLADRFALRTHTEHRPMRIYALVAADPARPAGKLKPAPENCTPGTERFDAATCDQGRFGVTAIQGKMVSMGTLASFLARLPGIERPVDDQTGISGFFDIDIQTGIDPRIPPAAQGAGLMTALREQLGLVLRDAAGSRDVVVIDAAERPTPN
jgi:uncharacterized protein (TIGR03435 family)